ncbi:CUB and sushi domain-containing protein 2, partial [Biomphalaria glabrata]
WIYHSNHCYFFIEAKLSWTQAEAFCSSKGGNLVSITSQTEQNYVTTLLRDIRSPETKEPEDKIWIGLVRHLNQSFIWSNGQTAVEQDGFWAVNGLDSINASPISRLCCYLRAEPPAYQDLRWVLTSNCEEPHASLCIMQPCEEQTVRCEDGSRCINKAWKCDGHWDCKDGSDEAKCNKGSSVTSPSYSRQCGSLLKGASGVLVSPNFPSHYPAFSSCTWKIEVLPPSVIEITVETLAIEAQYDSLQIFDCPDMSDTTLLDYLDGNVSNTKVISSNNCVLVKFQSDHSIEASGFNITWQAVDSHVSGCGGTLYATRSYQHLRFPTSRSRVFKQTSCEWLVSASASTVLHILMNITFQLKGQDTITIYDGPNSKSPLIIQVNSTVGVIAPGESQPGVDSLGMASSNIHPVIVSSGPHLYIHVSLGSKTTGQILSYSEGCDVFISSESSFILSPGYASLHYVNNLKCRWSFQKHGLSKTQDVIFFPNFHTEANKDYVQVRNASCVLETLSGIHLQYQRVSATKSDFFIEFVSDSTVNRGQWAALVSFDCDKFLATPPISVNSTENHFGVVIQFSCPPEYDLVGPASAVCGVNGQWFPSKLPSCKKTDCGPAPAIANGYLVDLNGTEIGSVAQYKCFNGYKIVNHDNAMCEKGVWKSVPVCKAITCPKEPPPANGLALAEYISYGYVREYFCADGYRMIGTKFSHCGSNGQWSHSRPICQAPSCPRLTHIPHGFTNASTDPVFVGTSVKITCDKGYEPSGPNILTCLPSLQYDRPVPFCTDIDECTIGNHTCEEHVCQNLPGDFSCFCRRGFQHPVGSNHTCIDVNECEANNGRCNHQCNNTRGGYLCQCAEHFLLYEGPKDRRSNVSLSPNKTCIETCQPIPLVSGMDVVYGERPLYNGVYILGTNATIKCPSGHHPALSITRCVSLNVWYPNLQKCKVSSCVKPSPPLNGNVYYHNLTVGSSLRYSCREGFVLNQPGSARYCVMNATTGKSIWTGPQPHCQSVDCSQPKAPGNGTVHFTTTYYNSVALFKCYCGFQLIGQSLAKCKADGQWSSQAPFCQIQSCKNPSSLTNASIIKYQQGFPVGSSVTFHCNRTGYTLSDYSSIQCLATKVSKESILQPLATLTHEVYMELGTHLISTCRDACAEKLQELVLIQLQDVVDTATEYGVSPDIIPSTTSTSDNLSVKLTITVSSTKVLNVCNYIDLVNSTMSSMDTEKFRELSSCAVSCPSISVLSASTKTSVTWGCFSGLTFNGQNCGEETGPVCLEECVEKDLNLASDEMINDLEDPQLVFAQSTVRTLSTDQIQSTALSFSHSTEKTLSSDLSFSTPEPITPSTANQVEVVDTSEETTQPTSNHPPSSPSSPTLVHNTSGSQDTTGNLHLVGPQRHTTQPSSIKTSNIEQKTEDPGGHRFTLTSFTDNPTGNYSTLKIDSDREKSPVHLNVTASTNKTSCSNVLSNVKSENGSRGQDSSANETWKDVNDQVNENDCNRNYSSGNQPNNEELLKQAVISSDTTLPIYSVVVTDSMTGAFSNISCINASHVSINTKVNDILREFSSLIGHTVCIKSNSTLELTAGNIKFMGLKASIYINFSLAYTVASEDKTERCAHQFQEFVRKNLPKKFDQVYREVVGAGCEAVNYTGAENEVSLVGWTCHHGYVMDETLFKCLHPRTKASSVPIVVLAVPRLKFAFVANFTADHLRHHMSSDCKKDYTSNVNSLANAYVQELFRNVSGFNVSVDKITTLSYGENVISCNGSVHLVPLQESLNSSSLLSLAMTLANHSQHPAYNLESANSPDVPGCTQIRLTSLRTVVDSSPFYCQPEDVFDDFNLKCLHEELPVLVANVSLSIQGHYTGEQCQRSVTASAEVMYKEVVKDIQISIGRRQICNTAKDTLIQLAQIFVNILDGKVQITLPLKVLSIQGRKQDCEKCVKEVFHYLRTALVQPTDAMVQNITQSCRQNVQIPENYTTSSAQWKCVPRLQYNSVQHRCESSLDDNNGHQSKRRSKRDVPELVDWSSPPPQCIDLEPPKFQDCPGLPRVITLNQFLSRQVVKLPEVTDNSGLVPIISYNSSYFKIGKPVPKSISLSIKAVDSAGLDATCNIELIIEDEIPPELKCPEVVNISERFPSKTYRIKYSDLNITYSDNSGNVTLKYYPSEDSEVSITEDVMVTVVAADRSGNTRTCQFKIVFFPQGCSSDLLPGHYGVGKNCTETGLNNEDLVCFITCPGHTEPVQVLSCHAGKWNSSLQECAVANGCPAGYSYASYGVCYECDVGYYRSNLTLKECVKCPDGQSTPAKKSTSLSECQEMCGLNEFSATGLKPCQPCPHGYHQPKNGSKYCEKCSHTEQYCQSHCLRGNYSTSRTAPCKPCPLNYYNLKYFSFKCNPCPDNQVTKSVGSKSRTECVPDNCPIGSFRHNCTCFLNQSDVWCTCNGSVCSSSHDPCQSHPCHNHGTCHTNGSEFTCHCPLGYTGPTCAQIVPSYQSVSWDHGNNDTQDCKLQCDNGGTCVPIGPVSQCHCLDGFTGLHCEVNMDDCLENYCLNGGQCLDGVNIFTCLCPKGFSGDLCQINLDDCVSSPCQNNGVCIDNIDGFTCVCQPGYSGDLCERVTDPCQSNPCENNGTCMSSVSGSPSNFSCDCAQGYTGQTCETAVSFCDPMPCNINGTSRCQESTSECLCLPNWQGKLCSVYYDTCKDNPCGQDAICVPDSTQLCLCPVNVTSISCY